MFRTALVKHFIKMPRRLSTACWHRCKVYNDHYFTIDAQPSYAFMKHLRQCSDMHNSRKIEYFQNQRSAYKRIMHKIPKLSMMYQRCILQHLYFTTSLLPYIARQAGPIFILIINHD